MKHLLFIYNPNAGKGLVKNNLSDIVDIFVKEGYFVSIYPTQGRLDAKKHVMRYGENYKLIVCCGGDGTLNEVVSGVMTLQRKPGIGFIPAGSTNDFAQSLALPKNMLKAARVAVTGSVFPVDVGEFDKKPFIYIAAFGAFTEVSYTTSQDKKNLFGHSAYIMEGIKSLPSLKAHHMVLRYRDTVIEDDFVYGMITNTLSVGGFKGLTGQRVSLDDGMFECLFIKEPRNAMEWQQIISALLGVNDKNDRIISFKASKIFVKSKERLPWVLDGEYGGTTNKVIIRNHRRAVEIIANWEKMFS
ncbi:diacylglycerol/lipid kinase family protein [Parasporobacterium paucivorans]|uniref:Lipid kinase, YegS/Rv2252/BmrU family n=1 Tax=Parasporobacterium paucivorans DSM 15970 TaxID=1122934 RepID=A0A1M6HNE8_9FIRM|nr:YegS/Rv2252/BmrU family lipid kinase [Parasporobacterium paucivorans]SHJ23735.1 lipid kinase, YegS/Rv2252/BmrU family [Parasporobacterium paucivorans DSM 15970]